MPRNTSVWHDLSIRLCNSPWSRARLLERIQLLFHTRRWSPSAKPLWLWTRAREGRGNGFALPSAWRTHTPQVTVYLLPNLMEFTQVQPDGKRQAMVLLWSGRVVFWKRCVQAGNYKVRIGVEATAKYGQGFIEHTMTTFWVRFVLLLSTVFQKRSLHAIAIFINLGWDN